MNGKIEKELTTANRNSSFFVRNPVNCLTAAVSTHEKPSFLSIAIWVPNPVIQKKESMTKPLPRQRNEKRNGEKVETLERRRM